MVTTTSSIYYNPDADKAPAQPPSVPLSVYRELADELKSAQIQIDALTSKNHKLVQENQLLRQEITKVVESLLHLQKLVDVPTPLPTKPSDRPVPTPEAKTTAATKQPPAKEARPRQQVARPRPTAKPEVTTTKGNRTHVAVPVTEMLPSMPETILIEEQEVRYYGPTESETKEISGWWLAISILLIMLTAFTAGYLVVRPFFEHQSR
ncbi:MULTISPECIES: hypothetical protein [unclassified Tolypothrix]|uniref:hypothetical protein n=1 Tax=unclassified Tolypothrix TaxID=2649714 RepID=UPI0005EAC267|nr:MULTISPECIES: hypothetical protein [unclassified Tolypothrix]BAY94045.1 hypothetical protein NIES3275_60900 [Microchaete diplosiphon NIES-3275]EKF03632.1 hypothetical protein FDUTEX481_02329 [Tolypothrix sp. PCC 7601]MBE9081826.1 hypothetical protein [Tolypothrix sp. LEGE 11397]UYD27815.1 hypothetical protein HGR01_07060 [Tolypothrix sp. PCC 7712]UYD36320.1 hypothetical protein HG267_11615 [Tolypothrix sp. PCC 7601]